jgi:hypothetical protein
LCTGKGKGNALPFFYAPPARRRRLPLAVFVLLAWGLWGEDAPSPSFPVISRLDSRDTMFRQYLEDVEAARRILFASRQRPQLSGGALAEALTVYVYVPQEGENLLGIAARCALPYGALATVNRFSHGEDLMPGKAMLLPSAPGIFIPEHPRSDLEKLLNSARSSGESREAGRMITLRGGDKNERFFFIPGDDFSPTERVFFLNRGFRFPLQDFRVSSFYGPRINPVTGRAGVHRGLDLAAPEGAAVYAVRAGTVIDAGEDAVFGTYLIIAHENNWVSLYGHLSAIDTALREEVQSGSLIGRVGSTGQSTGPHLHFELRQNGQAKDPARLLGAFK